MILAEEERHYLHCPDCDADFVVVGKKPLLTKCPSCGAKGYLK